MDHRKLVQHVKETRPLWDRSNRNFRDKGFKDRAWVDIAVKMNMPVDICKDTFKGLREKYIREREKGQNVLDPSREWNLLQDLKFLDPHILPRNSASRNMDELTSRLLHDVIDPAEFDKKLIELVKNATPIWDRSSNTYPNKGLKNQLWLSISNALRKDVESCSLRWKALREKYIRQKIKFQEGEPKWEYLDDMTFLDNVIQYRRKKDEFSFRHDSGGSSEHIFSHQDSTHSENFEYTFEDTSYYNDSSNDFHAIKQEKPENPQQMPDSSFMGESSYQKRPRSESITSEQISEKRFKSEESGPKTKSPEQLFGDLVASLLSRKPEKDRNLYMIEIMQVLSK